MSKQFLALFGALALIAAACGPGGASPSPGAPSGSPSAAPSGAPTAAPTDGASPGESPVASPTTPTAQCEVGTPTEVDETLTGDLTLAGWSAGNVEDEILNCVLQKFQAKYPNVNVTFEVIAGEYPALMATRLPSDPPDLFYVNQAYSQDWIDQGLLAPLDQMATDAGFDLAAFYPGYLSPFQRDGQTYAFPKDSSVLGMQTNDEMFAAAGVAIPTTTDELVTAAQALKDNGVEWPMCFAPEWQRAGAFVHGFGGGIVDETGTVTFDSPETLAGLQWYLDQYANGLATTAADAGAGWCGEAFGKELVAISFEGNWIGPFMSSTYPDVAYTVSAMPAGPMEQATLSYTVGYGIHPNAPNAEASWALLSYLTGQEGMQEWVNGGLVLPARSDVTPQSENQQKYAGFAEFAYPGEGVTPEWGAVSSALNGALGGEATGGHSAQAVVDATMPALADATGQ
jgi:multiple sugar transport system substrate-binding protein